MPFSLLPTLVANSLTDVTPELLEQHEIRLLMLDFDNTIVPYTTDVPTKEMERWLEDMRRSGISLCVVSNSRNQRVQTFCRRHELPCITHAGKPFPGGIRQCMVQFHVSAGNCALVGDQIYTDTLGANCAGVTSILVKAIDNHNFWLKARHVLELPFIFAAKRRRITS